MKIIVLNKEEETFNLTESGFSLLIEFNKKRILFDTGKEDEIIREEVKREYDLNLIDLIILSHGHNDHTGGLKHLLFTERKKLICHPLALEKKYYKKINIGIPISKKELEKKYEIITSKEPIEILEGVYFLGEIPRKKEKVKPLGKDKLLDDSGLAIKTKKGIVIITGCGHSGLINITEHAKKLFKEKPYAIIGGFHLLNNNETEEKINFLIKNYKKIYPLHCINNYAKNLFKNKGIKKLRTLEKIEL